LAVVLFFLVDILGLLLEPSTNGGRQLLWDSRSYRAQTMKCKKLKNQNQNTKPKTTKSSFLNSRFLKSRPPLQVSVCLLL
jgi:hypothetical protein